MPEILSIDQGTTGSTVILMDEKGKILARGYREFTQYYPKPGWVEHDPEEIWNVTLDVIRDTLRERENEPLDIRAIGITNQRETTILWNKETGKPVGKAIVWQCRRTAPICEELRKKGFELEFKKKTGLVLDAYFSGTKIKWMLEHLKGARALAKQGKLAFGTVDSWLIWKLTGGKAHTTDYTNASRTLLFNIHTRKWDDNLLKILGIPQNILPEVKPSCGFFGETLNNPVLPSGIPITGVAGDQQAAMFGQLCFSPGTAKNTYGTGCFMLFNTGKKAIKSKHGLLTTLAIGAEGEPVYALEGSVFIAGAAVQWLRVGLKLIATASESEALAMAVPDSGNIYLVPAFVGLGAPYWDMEARGIFTGITRGTQKEHLVRATLESIAYQTKDLVEAIIKETGIPLKSLKVDGGATRNNFLMQFQADILGIPVDRPLNIETTGAGAAFLAGLGAGIWKNTKELSRCREADKLFKPKMKPATRTHLYEGWQRAVRQARCQ
jgi:glycerol kinase